MSWRKWAWVIPFVLCTPFVYDYAKTDSETSKVVAEGLGLAGLALWCFWCQSAG